jgi:hypothetical protein
MTDRVRAEMPRTIPCVRIVRNPSMLKAVVVIAGSIISELPAA